MPEPNRIVRETLIKSCHAIWRPFSRLAVLSDGSISPASPPVTRLARRENDSPSDVTAFNQHFLREATVASVRCVWRPPLRLAALSNGGMSAVNPAVAGVAGRENDSSSDAPQAISRCSSGS
jgi:hypothetical protein